MFRENQAALLQLRQKFIAIVREVKPIPIIGFDANRTRSRFCLLNAGIGDTQDRF